MNFQCNASKPIAAITLLYIAMNFITACDGQIKQEKDPGEKQQAISFEKIQKQSPKQEVAPQLPSKSLMTGVNFREAARKVTPGVVHVNSTWKLAESQRDIRKYDPFKDFFGDDWFRFFEMPHSGPVHSSASGVILTDNGYIITNNHVVQEADEIEVVLHDQRSYKATVIGSDPKTDLALIKIDENNLSFIELGNSDDVEVGDWVLAVGNPFNLASTVTAGIVSAKARNINILKDREAVESFIQTDAAVNPGNSGGALVNIEGELIGINSAIATPTGAYAGYSFAIPVNIVKKIADDLLNFGIVKRGYLGIIIRDVSSAIANDRKIQFTPGVLIDSLVEGGAAMEAGMKVNDVIIKMDGVTVETSPQLQEIVANHRPGEQLVITVIRNNKEREITATLKDASKHERVIAKKGDIFESLGIGVQELTTKEKNQYGIKNGLKVIRITPGKIHEFTNMKEGFIITKVDGSPVNTKQDLINAIEKKKGGIMIEGIYPGSPMTYYYGFGI